MRDKCDRYVTRYHHSCTAWLALDPDQAYKVGKWKTVLHTLKKTDLMFPGDDEKLDFASDSDNGPGDKSTSSAVTTKQGAVILGSSAKKHRGEGYKQLTRIWRVQKQDVHDIPGLDGTASEEDVYKRKLHLFLSFDFINLQF